MRSSPSNVCIGNALSEGFTLLELLVVVAIISILAVIALPQLMGSREKAWRAACDDDYKALAGELQNELDAEVAKGNPTAAADVLARVVPRHIETNPRNRLALAYVNNGACVPFVATAATSCQVFFCSNGNVDILSMQYEGTAMRTFAIAVQ